MKKIIFFILLTLVTSAIHTARPSTAYPLGQEKAIGFNSFTLSLQLGLTKLLEKRFTPAPQTAQHPALLALCAGASPLIDENQFPTPRSQLF